MIMSEDTAAQHLLKKIKREKGETNMKTIKNALSIRNGIVRNSVSDRYYRLVDLALNPFTFIRFCVDLIDNH